MLLPYTICFCRYDDRVLMLYRDKPPNRHLWIPHFLPEMLTQSVPLEYYCDYHEDQFIELVIRPLAPHLALAGADKNEGVC